MSLHHSRGRQGRSKFYSLGQQKPGHNPRIKLEPVAAFLKKVVGRFKEGPELGVHIDFICALTIRLSIAPEIETVSLVNKGSNRVANTTGYSGHAVTR